MIIFENKSIYGWFLVILCSQTLCGHNVEVVRLTVGRASLLSSTGIADLALAEPLLSSSRPLDHPAFCLIEPLFPGGVISAMVRRMRASPSLCGEIDAGVGFRPRRLWILIPNDWESIPFGSLDADSNVLLLLRSVTRRRRWWPFFVHLASWVGRGSALLWRQMEMKGWVQNTEYALQVETVVKIG
jgi:hypothetical protein